MPPIVGFGKITALIIIATVLLGASTNVAALDTTISANVCQASAIGTITLSEPVSDSIHRSQPIPVRGEVAHINQVDIYVNDVYVRSVAVAQGTTTFETSVSLSPGTSTIRAEGVGSCNGQEVNDAAVVTYRPSAPVKPPIDTPPPVRPPFIGSETPTVTNPDTGSQSSGGGVVVSKPEDASDKEKVPSDSPFSTWWNQLWQHEFFANALGWVENNFDITISSPESDNGTPSSLLTRIAAALRGLIIIIGMMLLIGGRYLLGYIPVLRKHDRLESRYSDVIVRIIGVLLIIASLVVL